MIVLLLLQAVTAINITQFTDYEIGFDNNCSEFLLFQGPTDYMYMYDHNNQTEIWVTQNQSYAIYTAQPSDIITLRWKNGVVKMNKILEEGTIEYPLEFDREIFMCPIIALSANIEPPLYKCPKSLPMWTLAIYIVVLVLYGAVFGQQIPRISRWSRALYTRIAQRQ